MSVNIDNIILFDNITLQIKKLNVGFYFMFNDFIYEVYSTWKYLLN